MPELPEVETTVRGLAAALTGATVQRVQLRRADLRLPMPKNLPQCLQGKTVRQISRRAKYITITFGDGRVMLLHLGMSGRLVLSKADKKIEKHDHVIVTFADGRQLRFNDPRRFGMVDLVKNSQALASHKQLKHVGIEPLSDQLTAARLAALFKGRRTTIKAALLDQRLIAGLGNIYVAEALFWAGISPKRRTGGLKAGELGKLVPAIQKVLRAAIKAGGSSLRDYVHTDGRLGYFQNKFAVYDRAGQACRRCDCAIEKTGGVQRFVQGGRSTFWCPRRQT